MSSIFFYWFSCWGCLKKKKLNLNFIYLFILLIGVFSVVVGFFCGLCVVGGFVCVIVAAAVVFYSESIVHVVTLHPARHV